MVSALPYVTACKQPPLPPYQVPIEALQPHSQRARAQALQRRHGASQLGAAGEVSLWGGVNYFLILKQGVCLIVKQAAEPRGGHQLGRRDERGVPATAHIQHCQPAEGGRGRHGMAARPAACWWGFMAWHAITDSGLP